MIRIFENIDCMIGMEKYRDILTGRRTLAIVDPEYGIKLKGPCGHFEQYGTLQKINQSPPDAKYFDTLLEISSNVIVWGGNYFSLPACRCFIVWDKGESIYGRSFSECEFAWTSFDEVARIYKLNPNQSGRFHPTQKPVALYRWLLQNYAKPGDLILDTHVGSASSLIACEIEGFEYVGFELDKDYYIAATERIKNHRKQPSLFDKKPEIKEAEQLNLLEAQ